VVKTSTPLPRKTSPASVSWLFPFLLHRVRPATRLKLLQPFPIKDNHTASLTISLTDLLVPKFPQKNQKKERKKGQGTEC